MNSTKHSKLIGSLTPELFIKAYRKMLLIRRFEERAGQLYGMGLIGGFCHLYIGQEGVVIGIQLALQPQDTIITSYRDHGQMLACDMDPKGVMAELTGRIGGYSRGKGGSMHMFSKEKGFYGGHGIVGAQVPIGAGLAFAHKYRGDNGVCVAYMGDGAINQGQVYEAFNMASLWKLPVVFVVENNEYSMGTSTARACANADFHKRGEPYNIPGFLVDGMDMMAVYDQANKAVEHARSGLGPVLLHIKTYRYRGHSMSDPAKYRDKAEIDLFKQRDPIERAKELGLANGFNEKQFDEIEEEIKILIKEAVEFAQISPEPEPYELYTDVLLEA